MLTAVALLTAIGLTIWIWEPGNRDPILEGALGVDTLALGMSMLFYVAGLVTVVLSLRSLAPSRPGTASTTRCCSGRSPAWWCWPGRRA